MNNKIEFITVEIIDEKTNQKMKFDANKEYRKCDLRFSNDFDSLTISAATMIEALQHLIKFYRGEKRGKSNYQLKINSGFEPKDDPNFISGGK